MKKGSSFLSELAKRLTPPLAFVILFIVVIAEWGAKIPNTYRPLIYILGIGGLCWAIIEGIMLIKRREPIQTRQVTTQRDIEPILYQYLDWVFENFRYVTFRGIERGGSQVMELPLKDIYVPLEVEWEGRSKRQDNNTAGGYSLSSWDNTQPKATRKVELDHILSLGRLLVITGQPGSGKTTILQYIAWALSDAIKSNHISARKKFALEPPLPIPIYIPLSLYAAFLKAGSISNKPKTLPSFIEYYLSQRLQLQDLAGGMIQRLSSGGHGLILLLDGLDEVPTELERNRIRQDVEDLASRGELRMIVTSRLSAYRSNAVLGHGFRQAIVLPLTPDGIQTIVRQACACIYAKAESEKQANNLLRAIENLEKARRQRLGENAEPLVDTPLMVRMLLIVHYNNRELPDQRADLYQKTVDALLKPDYFLDQEASDEIEHRMAGSLSTNREMLQHLAFHMHKQGESQGREIGEDGLRQLMLADPSYSHHIDNLIMETRERGTLLEESQGSFRFIHLSFQEFLAGRYLVERMRDPEIIAEFLEGGPILNSWWREPILLCAGYLDLTSPATCRRLLLRLSGVDRPNSLKNQIAFDLRLAAIELAATAFLECHNQSLDMSEILREHLLHLHQTGNHEEWSPVIMATATIAADRLGYIPADLFHFVHIENGEADFLIAKYPVTNLQYQRFLKPENFLDKELWRDFPEFNEKGYRMEEGDIDGWEWLQGALKDPEYSPDGKVVLPRKWNDARFGISRRTLPVVRVSWYEANAYCKWLAKFWGGMEEKHQNPELTLGEIRLPTEHEWVCAAGGNLPPKRYPWPASETVEEIKKMANVEESGIGFATPVWMYPWGASSPWMVMDMSGNVWEWQANYYSATHQKWAVRGGSYAYDAEHAQILYREIDPLGDIGFRILIRQSRK